MSNVDEVEAEDCDGNGEINDEESSLMICKADAMGGRYGTG